MSLRPRLRPRRLRCAEGLSQFLSSWTTAEVVSRQLTDTQGKGTAISVAGASHRDALNLMLGPMPSSLAALGLLLLLLLLLLAHNGAVALPQGLGTCLANATANLQQLNSSSAGLLQDVLVDFTECLGVDVGARVSCSAAVIVKGALAPCRECAFHSSRVHKEEGTYWRTASTLPVMVLTATPAPHPRLPAENQGARAVHPELGEHTATVCGSLQPRDWCLIVLRAITVT